MLWKRVITAVVLLALLIPAIVSPLAWPFPLLASALVTAATWEWGRLNGLARGAAQLFAIAFLILWLAHLQLGAPSPYESVLFAFSGVLWVLGATSMLRAGAPAWAGMPRPVRLAIGVLTLWAASIALIRAHEVGMAFVLSVFAVVWVADVAAYAGGRAFGRHKLAPAISPGKTWEGALSAVAAVAVLAWAWTVAQSAHDASSPSIFSVLWERFGPLWYGLALLGLVAMSVVGDLFESLVKRAAGVKDSSGLLPGHGGVLDRIDALLPVFPLAMLLAG
jgi:phosphatidate cytidylyltransferase